MMGQSDAKSSAALQRSLTLQPSWRDNSGVQLIRCGAMQLQLPGSLSPEKVPMIKGAPSTLLLPPVGKSKTIRYFQRPKSEEKKSSRWTKRSPEEYAATVPASLRDRLALTRRLDEPLREECLERLDDIASREPQPRRLSYSDEEDLFDSGAAERRAGESSSDAGETGGFMPSEHNMPTMLPSALDAARLHQSASTGHLGVEGGATGGSPSNGATSPSVRLWRVDRQVLNVASRPDVWRVRPKNEKAHVTSSCTGDAVLACEAYPAMVTIPEERTKTSSQSAFRSSPLSQSLRPAHSAPSLPVVGTGGVSASTAVAAAKEELDYSSSGQPPVRGAQSLLRTSLRYMLQF
eukprot:TRINITY_DN9762_c0_g1_i1.p1 TRINITY_DN9762_c0_g1~~TRINITY_DN9762_c0_g1_i1.p1  ORF type:complete len:349 (-),score=70.05 TRINITY_DN9762_c0_g1_i1:340-1386(-)